MNTDYADYFLDQMGITRWVERQESATQQLNQFNNDMLACRRCVLAETRNTVVSGCGDKDADVMIIGEAPGFYEDKQGLPFVGRAGSLLNLMLASIGLTREQVFITNIVKCRPPENRDPTVDEITACSNHLIEQIKLIKPKVIMALGRHAGRFLTGQSLSLTKLRRVKAQYNNTPVIVTYHPAYLLRNPADKGKAYQDLMLLSSMIGGRH